MRRPRLYCSELCEGVLVLSPEESTHALAALRVHFCEEVIVFDGIGGEASGVIVPPEPAARSVSKPRRLRVRILSVTRRPFDLPLRLTVAVAMTKAQRQGFLIEKCTELGAAALWPIVSERSVARPDESAVAKWQRRAIEAAKQSGRVWVPAISPPQPFPACLERLSEFDASAITTPDHAVAPITSFLAAQRPGASVIVLVGPEGGWSASEGRQALVAGASATTLGPTILRTETAAMAVCAAVSAWRTPRSDGDHPAAQGAS